MRKRLLLSLLSAFAAIAVVLAVQTDSFDNPRQGLYDLIDRALADGDEEKMTALYFGARAAGARLDARRLTQPDEGAPLGDGPMSVVSAFGGPGDGHWDRCIYVRDWGLKFCFWDLLDCTSFGTNQTAECGNAYQGCNSIVNAGYEDCKG